MYNHLLDIFKCVADEGSINRASKKLFISPVSVYKEINKLEKQLSVTLFIRDSRGCHLTNEGKKVYKGFLEIKEISNKLIKDINKDKIFDIFVPALTKNDIRKDISSTNLDIKYNLLTLEDYKLNEMINEHKIGDNFCFGINDHFEEVNYDFLKLGELSMMLNVPKKSRLAKFKKITFKDIKDEKLLFLKRVYLKVLISFVNL